MPLHYFSKQMDEIYGIQDSTSDAYSDKGFIYDHYNSLMNNHSLRFPVFGSDDQELKSIQCPGDDDEAQQSNYSHDVIKAKIASHPSYPKLLHAYIDCQKVGAPPEIANILDEIRREKDNNLCKQDHEVVSMGFGVDPELDQFMETYYEILMKYKTDLSRPFDEATSFLNKIENQLGNLCKDNRVLSSDDDEELSGGEMEMQNRVMKTEDGELKETLLRKYGSHISSLKMEFAKKRKKVKLPKEARQMLLEWWNLHYKWPYPTEADKISLAEVTGLDQKQINNWFINQRKRHWKPSENMQLAIMNNLSGHFSIDDSLQD